jgi:hypothetical protein
MTRAEPGRGPGFNVRPPGTSLHHAFKRSPMMFFFSNRLGCFGSIVVSLIGTLVLLLVLGVLRIG